MKKPELIDVLFDLQNEYDFNLTYTTDHKYILSKRAVYKQET